MENKEFFDEVENDNQEEPKKKKKLTRFIPILVLLVLLVGIYFVFGDALKKEEGNIFNLGQETKKEVEEKKASDLVVMKSKSMNTEKFIKEYRIAKSNKIKYDRLSKQYLKGDYNKSFSVINNYVVSEASPEGDTTYSCITKHDDKTYEYQVLNCAQNVSTFKEMENPKDFIEEIATKPIVLNDFTANNSESNMLYFINGRVYTQELIDLIVQWHETGSFKY